MNERGAIIQARGLSRSFGKTRAVDSLDLSISPGEIFGLIGPDGAGKTTTLRMLAGLLDITAGEANVDGLDLKKKAEAIKSRVGYMAQQFSLYGDLTVEENLAFFADIFDVRGDIRRQRTERLLSFARLTTFRHRRAAHLSGGMQKKLALACTLIHQPKVLLLDEPTTGVDPVSRREFWSILSGLHLAGTTTIVSTPYMDEAERCQRVGLMYAGKLVVCGTPQEIQTMVQGDLVQLQPSDWATARMILQELPGVLEIQTYGGMLQIFLDSADKRLPTIRKALQKNSIGYHGLRRTSARMEEAFISLIRHMEA